MAVCKDCRRDVCSSAELICEYCAGLVDEPLEEDIDHDPHP